MMMMRLNAMRDPDVLRDEQAAITCRYPFLLFVCY
jgi:hypothetical protein